MPDATVYRDSNGVDWALVPAGEQWLGYVAQGERTYDPEAPDSVAASVAALRAKIDSYARSHSGDVSLVVRAKWEAGPWILFLLIAVALSDERW
jgi:hypothetical protein